jgi:hypothetical protein
MDKDYIAVHLINGTVLEFVNITKFQYEANDSMMVITTKHDHTPETGFKYKIHRIPVQNISHSVEYRTPFD